MILFEKNGQGFWDFDFDLLATSTNINFASAVKNILEINTSVLDIEILKDKNGVTILIYENLGVHTFTYFSITKGYNSYFNAYSIMSIHLKHAKKLGVNL